MNLFFLFRNLKLLNKKLKLLFSNIDLEIISQYRVERKMPLSYEQNKVHIYKYRVNNLDKVREIDRLSKRRRYAWKKIQREYLNILLD
jgi:hypothetical protein